MNIFKSPEQSWKRLFVWKMSLTFWSENTILTRPKKKARKEPSSKKMSGIIDDFERSVFSMREKLNNPDYRDITPRREEQRTLYTFVK